LYGDGFVDFVDSQWQPFRHEHYYKGTDPDDVEVLELIDGCDQENVGWMRLSAMMMTSAEWYDASEGFAWHGGWYVSLRRPPEVVLW
jgi:hypothetical protein